VLDTEVPNKNIIINREPPYIKVTAKSVLRRRYLKGFTSKPTILDVSVSSSLWYFTVNARWLWMKYFSSLVYNHNSKVQAIAKIKNLNYQIML